MASPTHALLLARAVRRLVPATTGGDRVTYLAVELVVGAMRDAALGEVLRDQLRGARVQIAERLGQLHPRWPRSRRTGAAILAAALLDGLMLHRLLDSTLPTDEALAVLNELLEEEEPTEAM